MFPVRTEEYFADRKPFADEFAANCKPVWELYCSGIITHERYCDEIDVFAVKYMNDINAVWIKYGGAVVEKRKARKV